MYYNCEICGERVGNLGGKTYYCIHQTLKNFEYYSKWYNVKNKEVVFKFDLVKLSSDGMELLLIAKKNGSFDLVDSKEFLSIFTPIINGVDIKETK